MAEHEKSGPLPNFVEKEVEMFRHRYVLRAVPGETDTHWVAHIAEYSLLSGATVFRRPIIDARSTLHDQVSIVSTMRGTGPTAEAALSALAEQLSEAVAEAVRLDTDGRNRIPE